MELKGINQKPAKPEWEAGINFLVLGEAGTKQKTKQKKKTFVFTKLVNFNQMKLVFTCEY